MDSSTPDYINESFNYEFWKTRFIELYVPSYEACKNAFEVFSAEKDDIKYLDTFFSDYNKTLHTLLNVLRRYIYSTYNKKLYLPTDIVYFAYKHKIIKEAAPFFNILKFKLACYQNNEHLKNFKPEYISAFDDFYEIFSKKILTEGNFKQEYKWLDNSNILWGIEKKYYNKIIKVLKSEPAVKCVKIFGSRVTNHYSETSDIDLLVEGTYDNNYFNYVVTKKLYAIELPYMIEANNINMKSQLAFIYRNAIRSNIFYLRSNYFKDDYKPFLNQNFLEY